MHETGHAQHARQIVHRRIAAEAPRKRQLHALEMIERAVVYEPVAMKSARRRGGDDVRRQRRRKHGREFLPRILGAFWRRGRRTPRERA